MEASLVSVDANHVPQGAGGATMGGGGGGGGVRIFT